jgi:hypothetical protein
VRKASLWKKQGAATTRRQKANQPEDRARSTNLRKTKTPGRTKEFFKGVEQKQKQDQTKAEKQTTEI